MSYQYNLGGGLKKITDPTNVTINYNHDAGGRIVGVTGENNLVNNVSQYASNFVYRAWGAVRDKDLGSNAHSYVNYNARLLPTTAVLSLVFPGAPNPNSTMTWNYDYYSDGRLQHAYDVQDNRFDRLQDYDHAGRLKEAYSGREARGLAPTTPADSPYRQSMQYDVWDNMTSKSGRLWRGSLSDSSAYSNNRRQFWSYDAEGNVLGNDGKVHTYDAVGKQTHVMSATEIVGGSGTGHPQQSGWEIAQSYDVAGKTARRIETRRTEEPIGEGPETNITETVTTTFYLYSTVLGAKVVELDAAGVKTKGFVYANGERLAKQEINTVWWSHPNLGTNSWVEVYEGGVQRQEMDPMGAEVGIHDPYLDPGQPLYKDIQQLPQQLYLEGGDPFDYSGGYELDGMPVSESQLRHMLDRGTAVAALSVNGNPRGFWDFTGNGNWGLLSGGYWRSRFGSTGNTARDVGPDGKVGDPVPGGETSLVPFETFTSVGFSGRFFMGLSPQNPLPTSQEVPNLKPSPEQQKCSDFLAKLFGGQNAVAGANGFTPSGDYRGAYTYRGHRITGHLSDHAIHVSGSNDQTQDTEIFVPTGGRRTLSTSDPDDNTVDLFYYRNLSGLGAYTLAVLHLDRSAVQAQGGRLHIGRTGGPGGDGPTDRHVHIELLKGKWKTFPKPSVRGSARTNLSVLCP